MFIVASDLILVKFLIDHGRCKVLASHVTGAVLILELLQEAHT